MKALIGKTSVPRRRVRRFESCPGFESTQRRSSPLPQPQALIVSATLQCLITILGGCRRKAHADNTSSHDKRSCSRRSGSYSNSILGVVRSPPPVSFPRVSWSDTTRTDRGDSDRVLGGWR